jgi:hemolysin activation/secretion protein
MKKLTWREAVVAGVRKPVAAALPVWSAIALTLGWASASILAFAAVAIPGSALAAAPADAPVPTFDVLEYVVEGNTVLPPEQVELLVQPYMGPGRTFKDVEAARTALEKAYQDAGFLSVVVSIPNQRVDAGEVKLEVTEARVAELKVTGAQYNRPSRVAEQVPAMQAGQVPYFPQVQDELAKVQRPDLQVTPLISAGDQPDQIQVELKVEDKPALSGSLEANSRQSYNTTRGRVEASASYNNLFQRGHNIGFAWQYAPWRPSDANTLTGIYGFPLSHDDRVLLTFTRSNSDTPTGTSLGGATLTRGQFFSTRWRHDLDAWQSPASHSVWLGFDYKNNRDRSVTASGLDTAKPPLRYPLLGMGYDLNWQGTGQTTGLHLSVNATTRDLAARQVDCEGVQTDQFDCKRLGARADFAVFKFGIEHQHELGDGWRFNGHLDVQLASGPLTSGEQFSLGGIDTVRGYYDYEQTGDQGWVTQLNVQTPSWGVAAGWRLSALAFFDRGEVRLQDALSGQVPRAQLGSYGLGWRAEYGQGLLLSMDVAMPLFETQRAADAGGFERATKRQPRVEVRAQQAF